MSGIIFSLRDYQRECLASILERYRAGYLAPMAGYRIETDIDLSRVKLYTRWRDAPATKKQIKVLHRRKIAVPAGLTKGEAGHLIGMLS